VAGSGRVRGVCQPIGGPLHRDDDVPLEKAYKACKVSGIPLARLGRFFHDIPKTKSKPSKAAISYQASRAPTPISLQEFRERPGTPGLPDLRDAIAAVRNGTARYAMIPVENSVAGRVADVHHLLPNSACISWASISSAFPTSSWRCPSHDRDDQDGAQPHPCAGQCRTAIRALGLTPTSRPTRRGGAHDRGRGRPHQGGHRLQARRRDLRAQNTEERHRGCGAQHHAFLVLAKKPEVPPAGDGPVVTTFIFRVRNVPAPYKALGGFATNGVNMTKLESYQLEGSFNATMFYADVEGHPSGTPLRLALEELEFHTAELIVLGTYPASPFRQTLKARNGNSGEASRARSA